MKIAVLLVLLSVIEPSGALSIEAYVGHNATLPCTYNRSSGRLHACWGRGELTSFGCANKLIASDGSRVKEGSRASSRYQLLGHLDQGDISLTILGVMEEDKGVYGCRVETPGLFNDNKQHVTLVVKKGAPATTAATTAVTTAGEAASTAGRLTPAGTALTPPFEPLDNKDRGTLALVSSLCVVIALITVGGLVLIARNWGQLSKIGQPQGARGGPPPPPLQLTSQTPAAENIYEVEGGDDGALYQQIS